MKILSIETSCDETAVAVVSCNNDATRFEVCASRVASQDDIHNRYGGIIPELACRRHIEILPQMVQEVLGEAKCSLKDLDGVAATRMPGLMGALLVGLSYAKGLAFSANLPFVGVNHLAGHLAAFLLGEKPLVWPHLGLVVSGGHTELYLGQAPGDYRLLGCTRDDAAGEAFDKVAKVMGMGYPGGREIEAAAKSFAEKGPPAPLLQLPHIRLKDGGYGFSFSGLKTAVSQLVRKELPYDPQEIAWLFQERVLEVLQTQVERALQEFRPRAVIFCGGVAANERLRQGMEDVCRKQGVALYLPAMKWCTDNAAMIGVMGLWKIQAGLCDSLDLKPEPNAFSLAHDFKRDFFPVRQS